ncbi:MAG: GlxA family transcriptional regulator [Oceanospirillaceae bacterium]
MQNKQDISTSFGFLLLPDFSMMSLSAIIEPLRMANKVSDLELYTWHIFTWQDKLITANNGVSFAPQQSCDLLLEGENSVDYLILVAGNQVQRFYNPQLRDIIRRNYQRGVVLGATSTASFLLGYAQLLKARRCTLHWEYVTAFKEEFPEALLTPSLFEIDANIITCSGGLAGLDMILELILRQHGNFLRNAIADQYLHSHVRGVDSEQRNTLMERYQVHNPALIKAITLMEKNIETPLSLLQVAQASHISVRQLQRLFKQHLKSSVQLFYRNLRLKKASTLLRESPLSIASIALICGFSSSAYFSKCYRQYSGMSPRKYR